tara:strand:+ start:222 stop:605 length:384 start_codon:yes stop_codon:yes gene_type:complete
MTIQIDESLFLPQVKSRFAKEKKGRKIRSLSKEVIKEAQNYFDDAVWVNDKDLETKRDIKKSMLKYTLAKINLKDSKKSFFIPTFIWVFLAQQVISYLVKLIIEHYWLHDEEELDNNLYNKVLKRIP